MPTRSKSKYFIQMPVKKLVWWFATLSCVLGLGSAGVAQAQPTSSSARPPESYEEQPTGEVIQPKQRPYYCYIVLPNDDTQHPCQRIYLKSDGVGSSADKLLYITNFSVLSRGIPELGMTLLDRDNPPVLAVGTYKTTHASILDHTEKIVGPGGDSILDKRLVDSLGSNGNWKAIDKPRYVLRNARLTIRFVEDVDTSGAASPIANPHGLAYGEQWVEGELSVRARALNSAAGPDLNVSVFFAQNHTYTYKP